MQDFSESVDALERAIAVLKKQDYEGNQLYTKVATVVTR